MMVFCLLGVRQFIVPRFADTFKQFFHFSLASAFFGGLSAQLELLFSSCEVPETLFLSSLFFISSFSFSFISSPPPPTPPCLAATAFEHLLVCHTSFTFSILKQTDFFAHSTLQMCGLK